jgi:hypothetical protein
MMRKIEIMLFISLVILKLVYAKNDHHTIKKNNTMLNYQVFNANNIYMPVENNGSFAGYVYENNRNVSDGMEYLETNFICSSGLWIVAKVGDSKGAAISMFTSTDFTRGVIDENGKHFGVNDSLLFRVYKIGRGDTPTSNPDYAEWPFQFGAPIDEFGVPKIMGDQTLWCTFTNGYELNRYFNPTTPLFAEIHLTVWGWEKIDNVVFLHWDIINKSDKKWKDAFVGIFVDPDVDDAQDDLVGSDSTLNMVYCYESNVREFSKSLQAIGYQFLETPIQPALNDTAITYTGKRPGLKNVPTLSPMIFKHNPKEWREAAFYRAPDNNSGLVYDRLNCIDNNGNPMIDPVTGKRATWSFSGDPVYAKGWLDLVHHDRRMMISTGPFDLEPFDTNGVTLAIIPIQASKRLDCVYNLKQQAKALKSSFIKQSGIYVDRIVVSPEVSTLDVAVKIMNFETIKKVELILESMSDNFEINRITTTERTFDFQMETIEIPGLSQTSVCLTALNNNLQIGKGVIFNINLEVKKDVLAGSDTIQFKKIKIINSHDEVKHIGNTSAIIKYEQLPPPPRLITPIENQSFDGLRADFSWTSSAGSDSNIYALNFMHGVWDTKILSDTAISLPIKDFVFSGRDHIIWTVAIVNYSQTIFSPDTFFFNIPQKSQLEFPHPTYWVDGKYYDDDNTWRLCGYDIDEQYFYIISDVIDPLGNFLDSYLYVGGQKKNLQKLNIEFFVEYENYHFLDIIENRAFIYTDKLYTYNIWPSRHFELQAEFPLPTPHPYLIYKDYVIVIASYYQAPYMLKIYKINNLNDIYLISEFELTDWITNENKGLPEQSRIAVCKDYLYVALGDWGVFDLSLQDSVILLKKFEIDGKATAIDCENDVVYLGNDNNTIFMYDVKNKTDPKLIHSEYLGDMPASESPIDKIDINNGYLYFSNWKDERVMVSCYQPDNHFLLKRVLEEISNIKIGNDEIWGIRNYDRIWGIKNDLSTGINNKQITEIIKFELFQNYPNPFNPKTTIKFSLEKTEQISLKIYNVLGQEIITLIDNELVAGKHSISWDGKNSTGQPVGTSVCFAKLISGRKSQIKKMLLLR